MAVLKNVRCRWASIIEPNTKFSPRWEIEAELSDEQAAFFINEGVDIKKDDEGIKLVRFKRNVGGERKDGSRYENTPPKVVDAQKQPFDKLVGNGSLVNIAYELKPWSVAGNSGTKAELKAVQVLELVEFSAGSVDEFEEEGETKVLSKDTPKEETIDDIF